VSSRLPPRARPSKWPACSWAPITVAEAPAHAAVLARLCAAPTSSIAAVAAIALSEQARALVTEHAALLEWRKTDSDLLPGRFRSDDDEESQSVARLRRALAKVNFEVAALAQQPTRAAALVLLLGACGLERPEQIEAAILLSRLPSTLAEALAETPTNFSHYPINLPQFVYEETP
jgi:hypothetical protein